MSDRSDGTSRPLIGFTTRDNAPPIVPAPIGRAWMPDMSKTRTGWPNRCLPMLIANQSGWELRNPCAFTATWMGQPGGVDVMITPHQRGTDQFLPASHFGNGILTWHLPLLFRTPPDYNLVETDWASASFSMNWKLTRKLMPVRFEVDEPICMIVPQRRGELEEFAPELKSIAADEELHRKYEFFLRSRSRAQQLEQLARVDAGEQVQWQGDYTRGRHTDGEAGAPDHQTRRHLRSFAQQQPAEREDVSWDVRAQQG
ncbi:DUF6065 family protein [Mycobacterium stomatepiae]|uniref:DUF6065 family protein n=1 Tax=Mycobacterium stomatepiae TaxID=470076 RepID=UPI0021F2D641|nr:DUF6065 family protein [Mycobacterium stomatepiae]MCV7163621.1 hypothetical protein [Mycobacterium stomatepiae]